MSPNDASNERPDQSKPEKSGTDESKNEEGRSEQNSSQGPGEQESKPSLKKVEQAIELPPILRSSLCSRCSQSRVIQSGKGSVFLLCQVGVTKSNWPKYPPQPIQRCQEYKPRSNQPQTEGN